MSFRFLVHPEAKGWIPSPEDRNVLSGAFPFSDVVVRLWPRRLIERVTGLRHDPYSFRAVSRPSERTADLFVDGTETPRSVAWLLAHELAHHRVSREPCLRDALRAAAPTDVDRASDVYHQVDPEERYADGVATRLFGERLDRDAWRERVRLMGSSSRPRWLRGLAT
mgnify:CR=1 FL=1